MNCPTEKMMTTHKRSLNVHLGDLRDDWENYCKAQGKKPSTAVRELVAAILDKAKDGVGAGELDYIEGEADTAPKVRKEIRLTQSEILHIEKQCDDQKISFQKWLVNLIRANLTKRAQFNLKETEVIWESCYQLKAIGRNINQIAKQLNEGKSRDVGLKKLEYLHTLINAHTEVVNSMVTANINRWVIK